MNKRTTNWKDFVFENGSYKLVSLFVTLILWVTILGRRDFMLTKDMDVEFLLPPNAVMQSARGERKISVKVSGPRTALKNIEVPFGVKVVSIDPDAIEVVLSPIPTFSVPDDEEVLNLKDRPEKGKQK
jgi:hypothetical protein